MLLQIPLPLLILWSMHVQIKLIVTELHLTYMHSFVASTSDFWAQPILKHSFGGCIANMMANGYYFFSRMFLDVSDTTMRMMNATIGSHGVLLHRDPLIHNFQAFLSFTHWDSVKLGQLIGDWLADIHKMFGIKPEYIGYHIIHGAANVGKSVAVLE
jgi:hypothetical protein